MNVVYSRAPPRYSGFVFAGARRPALRPRPLDSSDGRRQLHLGA